MTYLAFHPKTPFYPPCLWRHAAGTLPTISARVIAAVATVEACQVIVGSLAVPAAPAAQLGSRYTTWLRALAVVAHAVRDSFSLLGALRRGARAEAERARDGATIMSSERAQIPFRKSRRDPRATTSARERASGRSNHAIPPVRQARYLRGLKRLV